ncbi:hypothetical protein LH128_29529 [Sphingomonas sp. LH128]|nr:hypothetical protein LH128_29529 [Sphingomonas sp. LH128]
MSPTDKVLPDPGPRLHLFGVKGAAIPYLQPYAHRVASLDSQACGTEARRDARRRQVPKTDTLAADHIERRNNARWVSADGRRR